MKNFYEITDIDTSNALDIKISIAPIHYNKNKMSCEIAINGTNLYTGVPERPFVVFYKLGLLEPIEIAFVVDGKRDGDTCNDGDVAIVIESITINGHEIVYECKQVAEYISENCSIEPLNYMGFNGIQTITISKPFYQWLHDVRPWGWIA